MTATRARRFISKLDRASAGRGGVGQMEHARREHLVVDELERLGVSVLEFVDQVVGEQPAHQGRAAGDPDVALGPVLDLPKLPGDVTGHDLKVASNLVPLVGRGRETFEVIFDGPRPYFLPYNWLESTVFTRRGGRDTELQRGAPTGQTQGEDLHALRGHLGDPAPRGRPRRLGAAHSLTFRVQFLVELAEMGS